MTEVTLRPYIDGRIPSRGASSRLLQEGRADVEVRFIELVGAGSVRVYYPVESDNEIVAPCEGGRYFVDAVCPAVLGTDGRIARIFPPLEWVEGEDPTLVGAAEADRARVEQLQEEKNERFEAARAALDEEMKNLDERLETSRADITQAQEDAAEAILEAIATRDAAMIGSVDWYATTPTPTTPPTTGWSTVPPEWGGGAYIWRKTVVTHGDGTQVVGEPVLITGNQGPAGTGAALVRIDSTRGTVFKEAGFSTDLQATVFSGAKQITSIYELWEEFGPTAYLEWWWRKHDDSDFGLISSADTRLSQAGFRLTVSPADVDVSTVFQCVLHA